MTLQAGGRSVVVVLCRSCSAASEGDNTSRSKIALRILRREIATQLGDVVDSVASIARLVQDSQTPPSRNGGATTSRGTTGDASRYPRRLQAGRSDRDHVHLKPGSLGADLDEGGRKIEARIYSQASTCSVCHEAVRELGRWLNAVGHFDPIVGQEFLTRHDFFNQLLADHRSHHARLKVIRSDEVFHHWGLCTLLLDESRSCRKANAELSVQLAELGTVVATHLDPGFYRSEWVADLSALAAADHGDALRCARQRPAAWRQLSVARQCLQRGTGRLRIATTIATLEARLLRDQGRFEEAQSLLERSIKAHEADHDEPTGVLDWILSSSPHGAGRELTRGASKDRAR